MKRTIKTVVEGTSAIDGAGVKVNRVLGNATVKSFDPFIMLDVFDTRNPKDYIAGFPMHPHRGIETVSYLISGAIAHKDNLGNSGKVTDGGSQWMTSGSGILHEEMPEPREHLLGYQLWINLPAKHKMVKPAYNDLSTGSQIKTIKKDGYTVTLISGSFDGVTAFEPNYVDARLMDIAIEPNKSIGFNVNKDANTFVLPMLGETKTAEGKLNNLSAVLLDNGDEIELFAGPKGARVMFFEALPIREPIAWGGPIVMNTRDELDLAFLELNNGNFIK